jgi:hypothetical protein
MVRSKDDDAAVILALNPGEGPGYEVCGQKMVRNSEAGNFLDQGLGRTMVNSREEQPRVREKGRKGLFSRGPVGTGARRQQQDKAND